MAKSCALFAVLFLFAAASLPAQDEKEKPEFPPLKEVLDGYTKVISTADGAQSMYTLYTREKDGQMLAQLPKNFESKKYFIAMTVASGETYAGLQAGERYVYWKRYDKTLALIEPNLWIRSDGDAESRGSVQRLFTDRVLVSVPIETMNQGAPVIDLDALLVGQAKEFFGSSARFEDAKLVAIKKAKAFPENVEIAFEGPMSEGQLKTIHYSISEIPDNNGYKPRMADNRLGYFVTAYRNLGEFENDKVAVRYINRWRLEKADANLALSPPKEPIVFYIEHSTPVRYRRWVREGVLYWNKAFEKVGISNAIEVYYQDAASGAHMDKDPEDVRYNFIRWLSNDQGSAIGPSRVHPLNGEILDADIILTDGWIRHYWEQWNLVMPELAMEGMTPETLAWLADHPRWDPRLAMAAPQQREVIGARIKREAQLAQAGHPMFNTSAIMMGDEDYDGLDGLISQVNGMCRCSSGLGFDLAVFRMNMQMLGAEGEGSDGDSETAGEKKDEEPKEPMIDGVPERFVGPMLAFLTAHEVGHTLGLRHNFKSSSIYSLADINSEKIKGQKPLAGSVMDYIAANFRMESGDTQGDYIMDGIGPYDMWAIEYGYTQDEKKLKDILSRVAEPELAYATDEDTGGPDPLARRYDFSADPLDYAKEQILLANFHRGHLLEKYVKDGENWSNARRGYELTLSLQMRSVSMMANWIGGAFIYRNHKGDPNERDPIVVVPAAQQRAALEFVLTHAFQDEAFGLTPEFLRKLTVDKWWDDENSIESESTWPVHDRIHGLQVSVLTMLMNPSTLRRVYDNESYVDADQDAMTLPEVMSRIDDEMWRELGAPAQGSYTARNPMISGLRRTLQRDYIDRLSELTTSVYQSNTAQMVITTLALDKLRGAGDRIGTVLENRGAILDDYTRAHLTDLKQRIDRTLEAQYVIAG